MRGSMKHRRPGNVKEKRHHGEAYGPVMAVILGVVMALLVAYVMLGRRSHKVPRDFVPRENDAIKENVAVSGAAHIEAVELKTQAGLAVTGSMQTTVQTVHPENQMPFDRMLLATQAGLAQLTDEWTGSLRIQINPMIGCDYGELDAIVSDMRDRGVERLIASIEPLDGDGVKAFAEKNVATTIPIGILTGGGTFDLPLPNFTEPVNAGLFICGDNSGSGKCRGKTPRTGSDFVADMMKSMETPPEALYYFAYMVLDSKAAFAFGQTNLEPEHYKKAAEFVANGRSGEDWNRGVEFASAMNKTLSGIAGQLVAGSWQINLQRFDRNCVGESSR